MANLLIVRLLKDIYGLKNKYKLLVLKAAKHLNFLTTQFRKSLTIH